MKQLLILFLIPILAVAQQGDSMRLEKYLKAFLSANDFSGTILVIKDNKTIMNKSYGFSNIEKKSTNNKDTKYRIASNSKQFTALSILQLQEQGKLSVLDKLNKYLPEIPKSDSITLDMLLTHRAGIHDYANDTIFERINTPSLTKNKVFEIIKSFPLDFSPGSKYRYSNGGYFLLALIIEKVSGQNFDLYITNNILKKANMFDSGIDHNEIILANKAVGYISENGKLITAYDNMNAAMGCGNLFSTTNDIYKYYLSLRDTIFLSKQLFNQFTTPPNNNYMNNTKARYAYGIICDSLNNHPFLTHGGWLHGFPSDITMYFNDNILFVVFSNSNENNVWSLSKGLQYVLFNLPIIYPYKYKEIKVEPRSLEKFVGTYGVTKIYIKDNYLYLKDTVSDDDEIKLLPETETKFFYQGENDRQIEFELNSDKKIIKSWIIEGGIKQELK
jgi:CubicO group peptidase (beta-lactamase class C family)